MRSTPRHPSRADASRPADPGGHAAAPAAPRSGARRPAAGGARGSATLRQWLQRTPSLLGLQEQALGSRRMGQLLGAALPGELAAAVLPGRYVDGAWTLNASSPAVAAKLKLYLPLLLRRLQQEGWPLTRIQVRVLMPQASQAASAPVRHEPAPAAVRERLRAMRERRRTGVD